MNLTLHLTLTLKNHRGDRFMFSAFFSSSSKQDNLSSESSANRPALHVYKKAMRMLRVSFVAEQRF